MGAFKFVSVLLKKGIDSIEKFQAADRSVLHRLGITNAQIYQAKIRKAILTLNPALAFANVDQPDLNSLSHEKKNQPAKLPLAPTIANSRRSVTFANAKQQSKRKIFYSSTAENARALAVHDTKLPPAKTNQSPKPSNTPTIMNAQTSSTDNILKAQIEMKLFFSSANLPLNFAFLMVKVMQPSSSTCSSHAFHTSRTFCCIPFPCQGWGAQRQTAPVHSRQRERSICIMSQL